MKDLVRRGKDLAKPHNAQVNPSLATGSTGIMLLRKPGTELGLQAAEVALTLVFPDSLSYSLRTNLKMK